MLLKSPPSWTWGLARPLQSPVLGTELASASRALLHLQDSSCPAAPVSLPPSPSTPRVPWCLQVGIASSLHLLARMPGAFQPLSPPVSWDKVLPFLPAPSSL